MWYRCNTDEKNRTLWNESVRKKIEEACLQGILQPMEIEGKSGYRLSNNATFWRGPCSFSTVSPPLRGVTYVLKNDRGTCQTPDGIRHNGRRKPAYDAGLINEKKAAGQRRDVHVRNGREMVAGLTAKRKVRTRIQCGANQQRKEKIWRWN